MQILIIGGGICGLGAALLLARDGHAITVLERDSAPIPASPADAWDGWQRTGVTQFRQPHNFMPGFRRLLEAELPDVQASLVSAGAAKFDMLHPLPPTLPDRSARPIDGSLWTYTARRPVGEWVFASAAAREPGVTIRRGVHVRELVAGAAVASGVPHVTGVRTAEGELLTADLVIDAMGRQSRAPEWLAAAGGRIPDEDQDDSGFIYYTRYFEGTIPERRAPGLTPIGGISLLTLPGDNSTWSVTVFTSAGDQPLKNLRHERAWTDVVRACPLHAHWLDGDPITDVLAMGGIVDRHRRFTVDGQPVATGFVAIADAWACSNPSAGRGLTIGFLHTRLLRDTLRDLSEDPQALVREFHRRTEDEIALWQHAQKAYDRTRFAQIEAIREGREPPPPQSDLAAGILSLMAVMGIDAEVYRAALEYFGTITPVQEILKRPEVAERISAARAAMKGTPPRTFPGPDRQQLLQLIQ